MTLLGQQELLMPAPRRRLIVPMAHEAWWGVDPSTKRVAIAGCAINFDGGVDRWVKTESFPPLEGAGRLSAIYELTRAKVASLAACCPWPGIVIVEHPGGAQRNWPLFHAIGVTILAVHDGLRLVTGTSVQIEGMPPDRWKKIACGRGGIWKPKPGDGREYGVLTWARENGYTGSSWDEADAMGIAEAARREVLLEVR
jgi:hypothetical protein